MHTPEASQESLVAETVSRRSLLKEEYPQIQACAKAENAQIFLGDETGIKNNTQHGWSYAPKGQTPVQPLPAKRVSLNMISAITNQGTVRFMLYESTMTAKVLKKFLRALIESERVNVI